MLIGGLRIVAHPRLESSWRWAPATGEYSGGLLGIRRSIFGDALCSFLDGHAFKRSEALLDQSSRQ